MRRIKHRAKTGRSPRVETFTEERSSAELIKAQPYPLKYRLLRNSINLEIPPGTKHICHNRVYCLFDITSLCVNIFVSIMDLRVLQCPVCEFFYYTKKFWCTCWISENFLQASVPELIYRTSTTKKPAPLSIFEESK